MKKKAIKLETIKKAFGKKGGELFEKDLRKLHSSLNAFILKYGKLGVNTLLAMLKQDGGSNDAEI